MSNPLLGCNRLLILDFAFPFTDPTAAVWLSGFEAPAY
jgi:hypothetical protein